jgi:hypothetical protein
MTPDDVLNESGTQITSHAIDRSAVVSEVIDGEAVIINLDTGNYYSLNDTGSFLWGLLLSQPMDIQGLAQKLGERYVLPPDINVILQGVLDQWISEGLVMRSESFSSSPAGREESQTAGLCEFTPPLLEIHTDMQDFLLVDPIHEVDDKGHASPHRK